MEREILARSGAGLGEELGDLHLRVLRRPTSTT